jgi:hypothetical protein
MAKLSAAGLSAVAAIWFSSIAAAQTTSNFDGTYTGGVTNVTELGSAHSACGGGGFLKTVNIRGGAFSFAYNAAHFETIKGTVAPDGTVSGYTASAGGGVRMTGKIQGNTMTGDIASGNCKYSYQLMKK